VTDVLQGADAADRAVADIHDGATVLIAASVRRASRWS
jgi:hypothetical protein